LSHDDILQELGSMFGRAVKDDEKMSAVVQGGPGAVVAMWEPLDDWPVFRQRGLLLGPNDLRYVTTVGELAGVIAWGLRKAGSS
jgi:hypothetical protein